jgi:hypothetical protein
MKKAIILFTLLSMFSTVHAQVTCKNENAIYELLTTSNDGYFQLRTSDAEGVSQTSQPMACTFTSEGGAFEKATCTQSILKLHFIKNVHGLYSIRHEFVIPNKPELKDPMAGSYGDNFNCKLTGSNEGAP